MMVVFTTSLIPAEWQIPGYDWPLIIPLSLVVGSHILLPVRVGAIDSFKIFASSIHILTPFWIDCFEPVAYDLLVLNVFIDAAFGDGLHRSCLHPPRFIRHNIGIISMDIVYVSLLGDFTKRSLL
jgi:hypothetical protein